MFKLMSYNPAKEGTNVSKRMFDNLCGRLRAATAVCLTLLLCGFYPGLVPHANAQTAKQEAVASSRGGGQKEGITVHGHWTIDVRNPDGTLVNRHEFENALVTDGARALINILARQRTSGLWGITLDQISTASGSSRSLFILESNSPVNLANAFKNLNISVPTEGASRLVLSGTATAPADSGDSAYIYKVSTMIQTCQANTLPGNCTDIVGGMTSMTGVRLEIPLNAPCQPNTPCAVRVQAGQIIQVTVAISFS